MQSQLHSQQRRQRRRGTSLFEAVLAAGVTTTAVGIGTQTMLRGFDDTRDQAAAEQLTAIDKALQAFIEAPGNYEALRRGLPDGAFPGGGTNTAVPSLVAPIDILTNLADGYRDADWTEALGTPNSGTTWNLRALGSLPPGFAVQGTDDAGLPCFKNPLGHCYRLALRREGDSISVMAFTQAPDRNPTEQAKRASAVVSRAGGRVGYVPAAASAQPDALARCGITTAPTSGALPAFLGAYSGWCYRFDNAVLDSSVQPSAGSLVVAARFQAEQAIKPYVVRKSAGLTAQDRPNILEHGLDMAGNDILNAGVVDTGDMLATDGINAAAMNVLSAHVTNRALASDVVLPRTPTGLATSGRVFVDGRWIGYEEVHFLRKLAAAPICEGDQFLAKTTGDIWECRAGQLLPAGTVAAFDKRKHPDLKDTAPQDRVCPDGWRLYEESDGRTLRGSKDPDFVTGEQVGQSSITITDKNLPSGMWSRQPFPGAGSYFFLAWKPGISGQLPLWEVTDEPEPLSVTPPYLTLDYCEKCQPGQCRSF